LEEFEIEHRLEGFQEFFSRIEKYNPEQSYSVAVVLRYAIEFTYYAANGLPV
jgi:hypothetical protein